MTRVRGGDGELYGPFEVLSQPELAEYLWGLPQRETVTIDPGLVEQVARLQGGAA